MEVKVIISGLGIGIAKTGLGANLVSGTYISMRMGPKVKPRVFGITDSLSLGSDSSTLLVGHVATGWFKVKPEKDPFFMKPENLLGKKVDVSVSGTIIVGGNVDVKITVYDEYDAAKEMISRVDVESSGFQLSTTKIRGILKEMPSK